MVREAAKGVKGNRQPLSGICRGQKEAGLVGPGRKREVI